MTLNGTLKMKIPRLIVGLIIAASLAVIVVGLLGFAHAYSNTPNRCFDGFLSAQWPKWMGCAMAAHENLAGGLIGLGGALFAAWLAYSGAQDQLRKMSAEAREAARLKAEEKVKHAETEISALKLAREFLDGVSAKFPGENDERYAKFEFEFLLKKLYTSAHIYVSRSAANAPYGFGRTITTLMWRMEKMAETLAARPPGQLVGLGLDGEIRSIVEAIRKLSQEIGKCLSSLEDQRNNLASQERNLAEK
jgi:hypothetical protein